MWEIFLSVGWLTLVGGWQSSIVILMLIYNVCKLHLTGLTTQTLGGFLNIILLKQPSQVAAFFNQYSIKKFLVFKTLL